ncbi:MAG: CHAT domain-containing protein [Chloroflexota bacterium]
MAIQDYLDFDLNVELLDSNKLRVTVGDSPVGSVSAEVANPFTTDQIAQVISLLDGSVQVARAERNQTIRAFGELLFNTVFAGQIYAAYLASQERAGKAGLRIRLSLEDAGTLENLPWELLRDPRNDYLALSRQTPVIRYPRVLTVRPLVAVSLPLRVLVLIASPSDQQKLDVEAEWRALQESTADLRSRGLLELERVDNAQLVTLQRALREGTDYQVFHFIGHAAFDEHSQTGMLAFTNPQSNLTVPVSGEALARELSEENSIRLVVLNACQGARQNITDPFAGIASSIVARGIPAVVAMQFEITDEASRIFSQEFYRALSEGYPIEAAVAEARRSISSTLNNFEWATPVLNLRAASGILFPHRGGAGERVSTGGLREAIRTPRGIALSLLTLVVIGAMVWFGSRFIGRPSGNVTATPAACSDCDLAISNLRFFPDPPIPGKPVTVSIVLENQGTSDSGPFQWAWFANGLQNNPQPSLTGKVDNLRPNSSVIVKGNYLFGLWHTYSTTAWVNFDSQVPESSFFNNLRPKDVSPSLVPMQIDFTQLPNSDLLLVPIPFKGNEFDAWGLKIAPEKGTDATCTDSIIQLDIENNINRVRPSLKTDATKCTNLPIGFSVDQPVGGAEVQFLVGVPGTYTLDLFDASGNKILSGTTNAPSANQLTTLRVPPNSAAALENVRKIVFSGPASAAVEIQTITFLLPKSLEPKQ